MAAKKNKILNSEGQAIFEFIVFVPFYLYLLTVLMSFGNSLNASINQNKVIRGFFYRDLAGYSYPPIKRDLEQLSGQGIDVVGMAIVGYRDRSDGENAIAGCVGVQRYIGADGENETCEEPADGETTTRFIRLYTAYGVCGESWSAGSLDFYGRSHGSVSAGSCVVR